MLVMTPVADEYVIPVPPERLVEEILLLKVVKSVDESAPLLVADAVGRLKVMVLPAPVMVKSVPAVEVAKSAVPAVVCPAGPTARTPVLVMVTAPVAPDTEMPVPATLEVTPVLVMTPVAETYEIPVPPDSDVEEILLLKVVKSVALRYPFTAVVA